MLEWLSQYGLDIVLGILSGTGIYGSIRAIIMTVKNNKRLKKQIESEVSKIKEDIVVTQEGVIEAFKQAILGNDFKISINTQIDKKLTDWANKFMGMIKENEDLRTKLTVLNAIILKNTAAYNKLTVEEKEQMAALVNELDDSVIIEVEDDTKGE